MASSKLGSWAASCIVHEWAENDRVVRPRDLLAGGIPHAWLYIVGGPALKRVGPGLYVRHGDDVDPLILMARKYPRLTLGLTSALWAHGVVGQRPEADWFVLGARERLPTLPGTAARFVRSSWPREDREDVFLLGARIACHSVVRAVIECVRFERFIGREVVVEVVRKGIGLVGVDALKQRAREVHAYSTLRRCL